MTLVQAWIDSVSLLKPKNLKLFGLVTIKSIIEAYKVVAVYWSWLIGLLAVCWCVDFFAVGGPFVGLYAEVASRWLFQLLLFGVCLSTRPSMMQKKCDYFRSHMGYVCYMALFLFVIPMLMWPNGLAPWYIFFLLFFIDSVQNVQNFLWSAWRALKMVVYNYPLLLVIGLFFYTPLFIFYSYVELASTAQNVLGAFLMPISVCTYTNVYIKKLHDQFDLYFRQPR
jgi:hypothetical protein